MLDQVNFEPMTNWPPYNVEKQGDDQYRITMAVAGFFPEDIEVTQQENTLVISGKKHQDKVRARSCIAVLQPAPSRTASASPTS
jgi:HSP20 family molecular chaperone IbpA